MQFDIELIATLPCALSWSWFCEWASYMVTKLRLCIGRRTREYFPQKRLLCQPALWLGGLRMFDGINVARGLTGLPLRTLEGRQCGCRHLSAWVGPILHLLIRLMLQWCYSEWMWSRYEWWCLLLFCVDERGSGLPDQILTGKYS